MPRLKPERLGNYRFIMRNTLNEGRPKNKFEKRRQGIARLHCRRLWIGWGKTSWQEQTTMEIDALIEGIDYSGSLSRASFDEPRMDYL